MRMRNMHANVRFLPIGRECFYLGQLDAAVEHFVQLVGKDKALAQALARYETNANVQRTKRASDG